LDTENFGPFLFTVGYVVILPPWSKIFKLVF
jgi:hypothetical protein